MRSDSMTSVHGNECTISGEVEYILILTNGLEVSSSVLHSLLSPPSSSSAITKTLSGKLRYRFPLFFSSALRGRSL